MIAAATLDALAAVLLPGSDAWPSARELCLGAAMVDIADRHPGNAGTLDAAVDLIPPAVISSDSGDGAGIGAVSQLERDHGPAFALLRALAYEAYYAHPAVQQVLADRTGWRPGPAQPQGYPQVFRLDETLDIDAVRARGPIWRLDGTETAAVVRAAQEQDPMRNWSEEEIWLWQV